MMCSCPLIGGNLSGYLVEFAVRRSHLLGKSLGHMVGITRRHPTYSYGGNAETATLFAIFTPLYRRFRLSHVCQTLDLKEIYRLVSKILNFTPCGSVFGRFCVLGKNVLESPSKIYRTSIEHLSKIDLGVRMKQPSTP